MKQFDEKTYGKMQVAVIDANQVLPNPYQPRRVFEMCIRDRYSSSLSPCIIQGAQGENYKYFILPIRLN